MTKEKRDLQIVLDKLWIEYSQLCQKINNLAYFINYQSIVDKSNLDQYNNATYISELEKQCKLFNKEKISLTQENLMRQQFAYMGEYLSILKARIDDLSKQLKECK